MGASSNGFLSPFDMTLLVFENFLLAVISRQSRLILYLVPSYSRHETRWSSKRPRFFFSGWWTSPWEDGSYICLKCSLETGRRYGGNLPSQGRQTDGCGGDGSGMWEPSFDVRIQGSWFWRASTPWGINIGSFSMVWFFTGHFNSTRGIRSEAHSAGGHCGITNATVSLPYDLYGAQTPEQALT